MTSFDTPFRGALRARRGAILLAALALLALAAAGCTRNINNPLGWSGTTIADDTVYVGTRQGKVVSLDQKGALMHQFPPAGGAVLEAYDSKKRASRLEATYSTPAVVGDQVFITSYVDAKTGHVIALSREDLTKNWEFYRYTKEDGSQQRMGRVVANIAVHEDTLYFGSLDHKLYALALDGRMKWRQPFDAGDQLWGTPVVYEGRIYIGTSRGALIAVDPDTGQRIPSFSFKADGALNGTPAIDNGVIYIGSFDQKLYALDAVTGAKRWEFHTGNWVWARPFVIDGVVYVGGMDRFVYAIDAQSGALKWKGKVSGPVRTQAVIVNDLLIVASAKQGDKVGRIWAFDLNTGAIRWDASGGDSVVAPLSTDGQLVYFINTDGEVQAIDATQNGKAVWSYLGE
ncbi:MAG: PQQ-binding-like beta-propeller repeat protein [Chloroflexi bacterium]|nr:PQQ-binding-like beta-propeller repeat protein [Chloroflexota bacterium]